MSSKYSVTKGNECVNYAEIYSFLTRSEGEASSRNFVVSCLFISFIFLFLGPLWRYTWKLVVPKLRSIAQLLLQLLVAVCSLYFKTAKQKKKSSMLNAVLQECVPSTLNDKLNDQGRAIERNGVFFLQKMHRHHAQQMRFCEVVGQPKKVCFLTHLSARVVDSLF